jgi:hypothetical protein
MPIYGEAKHTKAQDAFGDAHVPYPMHNAHGNDPAGMILSRGVHLHKHFRVRLKVYYCRPQVLPELGRHIGVGIPTKLVVVVMLLTGDAVFAVREGAVRPTNVRVRTAARTKVVFMGSPGLSW